MGSSEARRRIFVYYCLGKGERLQTAKQPVATDSRVSGANVGAERLKKRRNNTENNAYVQRRTALVMAC
jgi:hypothetical protein